MSGVVIQRASGRRGPPGAHDGMTPAPPPPALQHEQPTPPPAIPRRRTRGQQQQAPAETPTQGAAESEEIATVPAVASHERQAAILPHQQVLADLYEERQKIDMAIAAIKALYE